MDNDIICQGNPQENHGKKPGVAVNYLRKITLIKSF